MRRGRFASRVGSDEVAAVVPRSLGSPHPVLDSVLPVVERSRDVETDLGRLADVASWLAYEELPSPAYFLPFPLELPRDEIVDFILVATSLNFAFTSFETHERWDLVINGRAFADADGLHVALQRALGEGIPILEGSWLASVSADDLRHVFRGGTSELQLLDERYSDELERAVVAGEPIEAGSSQEVELRAHTIYATALLCDRVNELRPPELRVIVPQIDARLWVPFHKTHAPHHLTRTIYY